MKKKHTTVVYTTVRGERKTSKTVKCEFCDFTCASRGMKNHLRSFHNLIETKIAIEVPAPDQPNECVTIIKTVIENGIEKMVIEKIKKTVAVSLFSPACFYCQTLVTIKNSKQIYEAKGGVDLEPSDFYVCNDCEKYCRGKNTELFKSGGTQLRPIVALKTPKAEDLLHHGHYNFGHSTEERKKQMARERPDLMK